MDGERLSGGRFLLGCGRQVGAARLLLLRGKTGRPISPLSTHCRHSVADVPRRGGDVDMMPVPSHLVGIAAPSEAMLDEAPLRADLRCDCGSQSFEFLFPGQTHSIGGREVPCTADVDGHYFDIVSSRCSECKLERVLLDADFHGWNGFICHDPAQAAIPRPPLVAWQCRNCGGTAHSGNIYIAGEGRADLVREVGSGFDADRWPDAFGWFTLSCTCRRCGQDSPDLFECETM